MNKEPSKVLLSVRGLTGGFRNTADREHTLDGVSFDVGVGEVVALVGETGAGKSTAALAPFGLAGDDPLQFKTGQVLYDGQDLLQWSPRQLRDLLGHDVGVVFQDPDAALNPSASVQAMLREALRPHRATLGVSIRERSIELLRAVGIAEPTEQLSRYPHQLPVGVRQRILLAMALSCRPRLLIADAPTASLDPTTQAQIVDLLDQQHKNHGMSLLLITHDFGVVAELAERVVVMHRGRVIEHGSRAAVCGSPAHPYTRTLLAHTIAATDLGMRGPLPSLRAVTVSARKGCLFREQCPWPLDSPALAERCASIVPPEQLLTDTHGVLCHDAERSRESNPGGPWSDPALELRPARAGLDSPLDPSTAEDEL